MTRARFRIVAIAATVAVVALVFTSSAFASVHVTTVTALGTNLSASLVSTGDSGYNHGNQNDGTSPVIPNPGPSFAGWFNQDVSFGSVVLTDPDFDGDVIIGAAWWNRSTDNVTWGPNMSLAGTTTASAEGLYSISATGSDDTTSDPDESVAGTIAPAFGIDKTKPQSMTDLPAVPAGDPDTIPVFGGGMATVTISATDGLSGVENLQYSADGGPWDYAWDADPGMPFTVPVTFMTPGMHTLSWRVFDNAGNVDSHSVMFIVRPIGFVPFTSLGITSTSKGHKATFFGEIAPMPVPVTVTVSVQRLLHGKWVPYTSVSTLVPAFGDDWAAYKKISADGRFRAKAVNSLGGASAWRTLHTY